MPFTKPWYYGAAGQAAPAVTPTAVTFLDFHNDLVSRTTYDHTIDLGNPLVDRLVAFAAGSSGGTQDRVLSSITLLGTPDLPATIHTSHSGNWGSGSTAGGIATLIVPAARSGVQTIRVVYDGGMNSATLGAWQVLNGTVRDAKSDNAKNRISQVVMDTAEDGALVAGHAIYAQNIAQTTDWTADGVDPTKNYEVDGQTDQWRSGALKNATPADATHTVTATVATGSAFITPVISCVSFDPA